MKALKRIVAVALLAGMLAPVAAGPAQAAFPGENGRIVHVAVWRDHANTFTSNPDGSDRVRLTNNVDVWMGDAVWSPDGRRIAFTAPDGEDRWDDANRV